MEDAFIEEEEVYDTIIVGGGKECILLGIFGDFLL
jgi:hypothetical protein